MRIIRYQHTPVYSPVSNFPGLRDEMDRLFDAAFPALSSFQRQSYRGRGTDEFPIDLYRDKESFVVRAELPGFSKEELTVEVTDGVLTLTAHQKVQASEDKGNEESAKCASQERQVSRSISLPEQVRVDGIQAKYENGVLTVNLPKLEEAKPRQITIDVK